ADLKLGPLTDNGGATFTHALLPGSPAYNAGTNVAIPGLPYDQRGPGHLRLYGARVDIGAYEAQPPFIICPADIIATNTQGQCGAPIAFTASGEGVVTCNPPSGSFFPTGTNLVSCTASNAAASASCSFKVIVRDLEPPVLAACPNISTNAPVGSNSVRLSF